MADKTSLIALMVLLSIAPAFAGIDESKLVDLTYSLDEQTVFWPTNRPFTWEKAAWGRTSNGYWYASGDFSMSEHGGTHIDAPIHFAEGRLAVDEIPLQKLIAPAIVIDVRTLVEENHDYRLAPRDLEMWEARNGTIPQGAVVLMLTGWGRGWPDKFRYLGSQTPSDPKTLHFPGFSKEAAEFLVKERHVDGIGIDTPSIDYGPSQDFIVHQIINGANLYGLENIANLDKLPPKGAILVALPIKIKGGTGGPVRIIGILP
ncbi:MAG TPA: cyclase family protein [Nitrospira sp.]|nr:cyclase family protein [Nitrospira sp.]